MSTRRYSEADLRSLVEGSETPLAVVRRGQMWVVNEAYLRFVKLSREQVEGRSAMEFTSLEAKLRLRGVHPSVSSGLARERVKVPEGGSPFRELELESGEKVLLLNRLVAEEQHLVQAISERLVATSAKLVGAHTEEAVRLVALEGFAAAGLRARFLRWEGERLIARDGFSVPADAVLAMETISDSRAIFGGTYTPEATHVYLPLGDTQREMLWVEGPGATPAHSSVLTLFAKVVGAALTEARLRAEGTRGRWEQQVVADVARFVAQPVPPSPEAFLRHLTEALSADAGLLLLREAPEGPLVLSAHVGLTEAERGGAESSLGRVLSDAVLEAEHAVLSTEAQEQALREASGGRLGGGAAVLLTRGGERYGTLQLLRAPGRPFGEPDMRLLGTVSELLSTLQERHRLHAESTRQLTETRLLLELARTTSGVLDTASILDAAADFLVRLLDVSNCFILLYDEQNKMLRGAAASATHRDFFRTVTMPFGGESLAARVARERRPLFIEDLSQADGSYNRELAQRFDEKAVLGLPLTSREELIGVVLVDDTQKPRVFGPALIELAEATCGQLALSIANARLYESLWASYAELAAARAEMVKRERLAALGELSAIIAHEVRNPLGVIFNAVASLRRLLKPQGDAAMLLDILAEESDGLNRMVSDLLDFARPREPILQPEDLGRVLQEALDAARAQADGEAPPITFQLEVAPGLHAVPMDRRLIRQALINMVVNAMHAMPRGGQVRVHAHRESYAGREHVRMDISDQGMGIPSELLHRVFEPFFTTKAQGTGLGLAVVKRILEEHRGEIAVESTSGRGTTFTLRFPLSPLTPS
ncbi:MAG TPA: ATP-binding protein [Myxococcaceae bacterium]|nr:ATP-binding protein [Myxococcaceae bacterium]